MNQKYIYYFKERVRKHIYPNLDREMHRRTKSYRAPEFRFSNVPLLQKRTKKKEKKSFMNIVKSLVPLY
jgi:hypothetical protein